MKLKIKKLILIAMMLAGSFLCTNSIAQNLISNSTFDVDLTSWSGNAYRTTSTSFGIAENPQFASGGIAQFNNNAGGGMQNLSQTLNIQTAGTYNLSFSYGFRSGYSHSLRALNANGNTGAVSIGGVPAVGIAITSSGSTNN